MLLHNKFEIRPLEDSIFHINILPNVDIEVPDSIRLREMLFELTAGEKFCLLVNASEAFSISAEARELIAGKDFSRDRIALAFVTRAMANILQGNFFIKVNKPITPTRIFPAEESALEWLREQLREHK